MEESKAIHRLVEAQDLVGMVEDMLSADMLERLSPSAWSGIRITLRNIKDAIGTSHAVMANELVQRARGANPTQTHTLETRSSETRLQNRIDQRARSEELASQGHATTARTPMSGNGHSSVSQADSASPSDEARAAASHEDIRINPPLSRRDLKASLERLVDRQ
jgi:hypothetical protein